MVVMEKKQIHGATYFTNNDNETSHWTKTWHAQTMLCSEGEPNCKDDKDQTFLSRYHSVIHAKVKWTPLHEAYAVTFVEQLVSLCGYL